MIVTFDEEILDAMDKLGRNFPHLKWDFSPDKRLGTSDLVSHFLGDQHEDVMVNLFKGKSLSEDFHRQDFFFLHFAFIFIIMLIIIIFCNYFFKINLI